MDEVMRCQHRWINGDWCTITDDKAHVCWRTTEHRTHICDCNAIACPPDITAAITDALAARDGSP